MPEEKPATPAAAETPAQTPTSAGPPAAPKPDATKPEDEEKPAKGPRDWHAGIIFLALLLLVALGGGYFLWIKG
ncbi:MAG: hypothetical protein K0S68_102 [Candidatus Saccharibacteria bacterium]|jgi:hypothetical protein|nr:hypothetical protein [Candidatus Saccharibacteria bacterium]